MVLQNNQDCSFSKDVEILYFDLIINTEFGMKSSLLCSVAKQPRLLVMTGLSHKQYGDRNNHFMKHCQRNKKGWRRSLSTVCMTGTPSFYCSCSKEQSETLRFTPSPLFIENQLCKHASSTSMRSSTDTVIIFRTKSLVQLLTPFHKKSFSS